MRKPDHWLDLGYRKALANKAITKREIFLELRKSGYNIKDAKAYTKSL
jgi:hypothetical protein